MNAPTSDITSNTYYDWFLHNAYFICVAQTAAMKFAQTFEAYPPAQLAPSFTIDAAMAKMHEAASEALHQRPTRTLWLPHPVEGRAGTCLFRIR